MKPPVVVITGPTAAGKSRVALGLAEAFGGEIVNADSMQVYRYLDIGTAKPAADDRSRVPHHLLDVVAPDAPYNAGRYVVDARRAAERIHAAGRPVFLVGGTGLYIRSFLEGLAGSAPANAALRAKLEGEDTAARAEGDPARLHRRLAELDPVAARNIHPNDTRRLIRAIELCLESGRRASAVRDEHGFEDRPYRSLHLALDPGVEALDDTINERCRRMIEAGLLREVRSLRDRGYGPELKPLQSLGYRHIAPVVDGLDTLENALALMQRDTRRFTRRQRTWIRAVSEAVWLRPTDVDAVWKAVDAFLR